jgi:hypothetical protein
MREYDTVTIVRFEDGTSKGGRGYMQKHQRSFWFSFHHGDEYAYIFDAIKQKDTGYYFCIEGNGEGELTLRKVTSGRFRGIGFLGGQNCTISIYEWPQRQEFTAKANT